MTRFASAPLSRDQRRALYLLDVVCGTPEGYRLHFNRREVPCGACHRAWDISPGCAPVTREGCGTAAGWQAHRKRWEWPCPPCSVAREAYEEDRCGSVAGWMLHRRNGTVVCSRCRQAVREYYRDRAGERPMCLPREIAVIDPRSRSGRLRRALLSGAVLECTRPGMQGTAVSYSPRSLTDKAPWRVLSDPPRHVMAADLRAVRPEGSE